MISIIELVLLEAISFSFRSIRNGSISPQFFPMHSMASNLHHQRIALPGLKIKKNAKRESIVFH
jgi:hypothetical protein